MFYTYVLQSKKDGHWYTGFTDNLRERFRQHSENKVLSTKGRGPFILIYYEACLNKDDAISREKYLKSGMGKRYLKKRYLKNRLKRSLSLTGLADDFEFPTESRGNAGGSVFHRITLDSHSGFCYLENVNPPRAYFGRCGVLL